MSFAGITKLARREVQLWDEILKRQGSDPQLKEMLDEIKTWYLLKYSGEEYAKPRQK